MRRANVPTACTRCDKEIPSTWPTRMCRYCYQATYLQTAAVSGDFWRPAPAKKIYHVPDYKTDTVKRRKNGVYP